MPEPMAQLAALLGDPVWLRHLPAYLSASLQDIRLHRGRAAVLVCGGAMFFPQRDGGLASSPGPAPVVYSAAEMDDLLCSLCGGAVYAHEEELRRGCIALPGGHRAGVCGTAAVENGRVQALKEITSVVIRVAREKPGCSRPLLRALGEDWRWGFLLAGEPSSGKTTVLRDLAETLSDGRQKPVRVAVLDERGEFSSLLQKEHCTAEVLSGFPKAEGIARAIRYLAPELLVCDEIASREEVEALALAAGAGVAVAASMHAGSEQDLARRPLWQRARGLGLFPTVAYLDGKTQPGVLRCVQKEEEHEAFGRCFAFGGSPVVGTGTEPLPAAASGRPAGTVPGAVPSLR